MAGDDLQLTARLKVVLDETATRQEAQKAAGVFGEAFQNFGKGFLSGVTGHSPETRTAEGGVGVAAGQLALLSGSLYTLKRILGVLEESSGYLHAQTGIIGTAISLALKPFGDLLAKFLQPISLTLLQGAVKFNENVDQSGFVGGIMKSATDFDKWLLGIGLAFANIQQQGYSYILNKILPPVGASPITAAGDTSLIARDPVTNAAMFQRLGLGGAWTGPPAGILSVAGGGTGAGPVTVAPNQWGSVVTNAFGAQRPPGWTSDQGWIPTIASMESFVNAYGGSPLNAMVADTRSNIFGGKVGFSAAQGYLANLASDPNSTAYQSTMQELAGLARNRQAWDVWQSLGRPPLYDPTKDLAAQRAAFPGGMLSTQFDQILAGYKPPATTSGLVNSSLGIQGLLQGVMSGDLSGMTSSPWYSSLGSTPQAAFATLQKAIPGFAQNISPNQISVSVYIGDQQLREIIKTEIASGAYQMRTATP